MCGVSVYGHHGYGVPFGRARIVLIYLATLMWNGDSDYVTGSLDEMADWFGISWPVELLAKYLHSVLQTRYQCGDVCVCAPARCRELQSVASRIRYCSERRTMGLFMAQDFARSTVRGVDCPAEPIKRLVQGEQMAALDLMVWGCHRVRERQTDPVNAFGPDGPYAWIKSAARRFRKRKELARTYAEVIKAWPEFPYHLEDGDMIVYDPTRAPVVEVSEPVRQTEAEAPIVPEPVHVVRPRATLTNRPEKRAARAPQRPRPARPARRARPAKRRAWPMPDVVVFKRKIPPLIRRPGQLPELPELPKLPELPPLPEPASWPSIRGIGRDPPDSS